jgi:hypothetical protein
LEVESPTTEWNGFKLGDGWWIENSLAKIINGDTGSIRTKFPTEKPPANASEPSTDIWRGDGQYEDTYIPIPRDVNGDFLNSFTVRVSYEFQDAPNGRSINHFVDTTHDYLKPGFFCNSGIKIDEKTEVQIFDSASLLAAKNGVQVISEETPPPPGNRIWSVYAANGTDLYLALQESGPRPPDWPAERFSALINGAAYLVPTAQDEKTEVLQNAVCARFRIGGRFCRHLSPNCMSTSFCFRDLSTI